MYIPIIQLKKYELAIKRERERERERELRDRVSERGERERVKENETAPLGVILVFLLFYTGLDSDRWVPLLSILLRECH